MTITRGKPGAVQLLLRAVVALPLEPVREVGLQVRIGRLLAPAGQGVREVSVVDDQGVTRLRVLVEPFGQQQHRPEVHVAAPELRELLAADAFVAHVLRVLRRSDGGNQLVQLERDALRALRAEGQLARGAVQVAGRRVPLLPLAPVHGQLHHVAIGAAERLVLVEQRLHVVAAVGKPLQAVQGEAEDAGVDHRLLPGLPAQDVDAEHELGLEAGVAHLKTRLGREVVRDEQQQAAVERPGSLVGGIRDLEPGGVRGRGRLRLHVRPRGQQEDGAEKESLHASPRMGGRGAV
jgi:hypothetical protein